MPNEPGDDGGVEPDYRFSLANERTFLAWVRTSLALLAGGIALEEIATESLGDTARRTLSVAAVALSLVLAGSSYVAVAPGPGRDASTGGRLPHPWAVPLLATAVVAGRRWVAIVLVHPVSGPIPTTEVPVRRRGQPSAPSWPGCARR